jgi:hypothetical protein
MSNSIGAGPAGSPENVPSEAVAEPDPFEDDNPLEAGPETALCW